MIMHDDYLSLREIGRRLNIPPSSLAYYKDKFQQYIPQHAGGGKRVRYPAEALAVFKEIREMFNNNYTTEQIERGLAQRPDASHAFPKEHQTPTRELGPVLDKLADLLDAQALFRAEIDALRHEVATLKQERDESRDTVLALQAEVDALRKERALMFEEVWERLETRPTRDEAPPRSYLHKPLVVMNDKGEFLGVAGKSGHFSLAEFIRLVRESAHARAGAGRRVTLRWKRHDRDRYTLTISTRGEETAHEHQVETQATTTPSGNAVTRIQNLVIDGEPVPEPFLLVLFRKIREDFAG